MENIALRIWQIWYTFVLRVENNTQLITLGYSFLTDNTKLQKICQVRKGYIFHSFQHFTTKLCNFTKFRMLFQAVVIFFPISIFFLNFVQKVKGPFQPWSDIFLSLPGGVDVGLRVPPQTTRRKPSRTLTCIIIFTSGSLDSRWIREDPLFWELNRLA